MGRYRTAVTVTAVLLVAAMLFLPSEGNAGEPANRGTWMRWKFGSKSDPEYQQTRSKVIRRIDDWWRTFEKDRDQITASFKKGSDWDLPGWMNRHLNTIDERLMWEFGPGVKGGHRLVITPESDRFLRPLVETLLERAPRMEGWEFYPYRLAEGDRKSV